MKYLIPILFIVSLISCSPIQQIPDMSPPIILVQRSLPAHPSSMNIRQNKLDIMLYVNEAGFVDDAVLLDKSGSNLWDSLAGESLRQWRFLPARKNNVPVSTWLRLKAFIRYADPLYFPLAEILCSSKIEAESVYTALTLGEDFIELAGKHHDDSLHQEKSILGKTDINTYPEDIRIILKHLEIDEVTRPIKYGEQYVLFKRLKE